MTYYTLKDISDRKYLHIPLFHIQIHIDKTEYKIKNPNVSARARPWGVK